jgi:hypothetical protein
MCEGEGGIEVVVTASNYTTSYSKMPGLVELFK